MKRTIQNLCIAFTGILPAGLYGQCASPANIWQFAYNGKNYEVVKEAKSWQDAAACAVERGGYLVRINNVAEQNAVYNAITAGASVSSTYTVVNDGGGIAYVWIGASDKITEGIWLWDGNNDNTGINFWNGQGAAGAGGGAAVGGSYINWGGTNAGTPNEPDNYAGAQDAAAIGLEGWPSGTTVLGDTGEWNDIGINNNLYFVIEYDSAGSGKSENDFPMNDDLLIYPNPASGVCTINLTGQSERICSLFIYDAQGTIVYKHPDLVQLEMHVDFSHLDSGFYMVNMKLENGGIINKKIIID